MGWALIHYWCFSEVREKFFVFPGGRIRPALSMAKGFPLFREAKTKTVTWEMSLMLAWHSEHSGSIRLHLWPIPKFTHMNVTEVTTSKLSSENWSLKTNYYLERRNMKRVRNRSNHNMVNVF